MFHGYLEVEGSIKHLVMQFREFCPGALNVMEMCNLERKEKKHEVK